MQSIGLTRVTVLRTTAPGRAGRKTKEKYEGSVATNPSPSRKENLPNDLPVQWVLVLFLNNLSSLGVLCQLICGVLSHLHPHNLLV